MFLLSRTFRFVTESTCKWFKKTPCTMTSTAQKTTDTLLADKDAQQIAQMEQDMCILVDEQDQVIGKASKRDCHLMENIDKGMLHRAFSVIIFNSRNECLLTQRASTKITFPNFYTNACCSHPLSIPLELDESDPVMGVKRAAQRRLQTELGINPAQAPLEDFKYLTRILYKAPSLEGVWGEHEVDYILILHKDVDLNPNTNELNLCKYYNKTDFKAMIDKGRKEGLITPWFEGIHDKFLYQWWDNLDNLDQFVEPNKITRL